MSGVSFNQISSNWKVPLVSIEVDNSQANSATGSKAALITDIAIGGSADYNKPIAVSSPAQAAELFGAGSPLERAYSAFYANNQTQMVYCMGIEQPSGVAASLELTVPLDKKTSSAGNISLYIAGQLVSITIPTGANHTTISSLITKAINGIDTLPVTASYVSNAITLTAKWNGICGNDITVVENYLGEEESNQSPAGITLTIPGGKLTGGVGVPNWSNAIAALGDDTYKFVAMAHTDSASLDTWNTEFGFTESGRWGWVRMQYGQIWSALRDSYAKLVTAGGKLNYPTTSILAIEKDSPSPVWEWAGAYAGRAAAALTIDPARPLQTLTLQGVLPAPKESRFTKIERNNLASNGLATQSVYNNNTPQIEREQTTYQFNSYGNADNSYGLATTLATLDEVLTRMASAINTKYPRHKLTNDDTSYASGQAIITPKLAKAELIAEYRRLEYEGLVENTSAFKTNLVAQRSESNPNRLEVLYPPYLIGGLRNFDVLAQFRLEASTSQSTTN